MDEVKGMMKEAMKELFQGMMRPPPEMIKAPPAVPTPPQTSQNAQNQGTQQVGYWNAPEPVRPIFKPLAPPKAQNNPAEFKQAVHPKAPMPQTAMFRNPQSHAVKEAITPVQTHRARPTIQHPAPQFNLPQYRNQTKRPHPLSYPSVRPSMKIPIGKPLNQNECNV